MARNTLPLSRIMRMSWDIQKTKYKTRQTSLRIAWAIFNNEEMTLHYLTRKLNHDRPVKEKVLSQFALFAQ